MEHVAANGNVADLLRAAITRIAEKGEARLGEMNTNLMHAAGDRYDLDKRAGTGSGEEAEAGYSLLSALGDGSNTIITMATRQERFDLVSSGGDDAGN